MAAFMTQGKVEYHRPAVSSDSLFADSTNCNVKYPSLPKNVMSLLLGTVWLYLQ